MVSLHMCSETFEKRGKNNEKRDERNWIPSDAFVFLLLIRLLCFHLESFLSFTIWAALYFPKQSESFGLIIVYGMFRLNSIDFPGSIESLFYLHGACFSFHLSFCAPRCTNANNRIVNRMLFSPFFLLLRKNRHETLRHKRMWVYHPHFNCGEQLISRFCRNIDDIWWKYAHYARAPAPAHSLLNWNPLQRHTRTRISHTMCECVVLVCLGARTHSATQNL